MKTSKRKKSTVNVSKIDFAVDTALSWDGFFPPVGTGDFVVTVQDGKDTRQVLVSRRYTVARGAEEAGEIALDAVGEKYGYRKPGSEKIICKLVEEIIQ